MNEGQLSRSRREGREVIQCPSKRSTAPQLRRNYVTNFAAYDCDAVTLTRIVSYSRSWDICIGLTSCRSSEYVIWNCRNGRLTRTRYGAESGGQITCCELPVACKTSVRLKLTTGQVASKSPAKPAGWEGLRSRRKWIERSSIFGFRIRAPLPYASGGNVSLI